MIDEKVETDLFQAVVYRKKIINLKPFNRNPTQPLIAFNTFQPIKAGEEVIDMLEEDVINVVKDDAIKLISCDVITPETAFI